MRLFTELRITMAEALTRAAEGKNRDIPVGHITSNTPDIWSLTLAAPRPRPDNSFVSLTALVRITLI